MLCANVKSRTYFDFDKKNNKEDPKFKVGNRVRLSKYKNIFEKGSMQNWSVEIFVITKVKNTYPLPYVISDLKGEEFAETFCKTELD